MHSNDIMVNLSKLPSCFRDPTYKAAIMSRNISALSDVRINTSPLVKDAKVEPNEVSKRDTNSNGNYSAFLGVE